VNTPSTQVSPGLGGFLAFFLLAIALWLLMRNMNARMRRMSYRAQQEEEARRAEGSTAPEPRSERDGSRGEAETPQAETPETDGRPEGGDGRPPG
jgi:hypothetical protein